MPLQTTATTQLTGCTGTARARGRACGHIGARGTGASGSNVNGHGGAAAAGHDRGADGTGSSDGQGNGNGGGGGAGLMGGEIGCRRPGYIVDGGRAGRAEGSGGSVEGRGGTQHTSNGEMV